MTPHHPDHVERHAGDGEELCQHREDGDHAEVLQTRPFWEGERTQLQQNGQHDEGAVVPDAVVPAEDLASESRGYLFEEKPDGDTTRDDYRCGVFDPQELQGSYGSVPLHKEDHRQHPALE